MSEYKTMGDMVREHAKKPRGGTIDGIKMLELDHPPLNVYTAANLYCAALDIIMSQERALAARQHAGDELAAAVDSLLREWYEDSRQPEIVDARAALTKWRTAQGQ